MQGSISTKSTCAPQYSAALDEATKVIGEVQTKSPEELKKEELRERMKQAQAFYSKRKKEENRAQLKKFNVFKQTFLFQIH